MILVPSRDGLAADPKSSPTPPSTEYSSFFSDKWYIDLKGLKGVTVRDFNRVDGFVPLFRIAIREVEEGSYPSLNLATFYYIERRRAGWSLSMDYTFLDPSRFLVKCEFFRATDTKDRWRMSDLENSIASFLLKEDFRDYYERYGFRLSVEKEIGFFQNVSLEYVDEDVHSLSGNNPFTLFGWDKEFRENPAINEGEERALSLEWVYDSRDNIRFPRKGWFSTMSVESSPRGLGGDFSYNLFRADIRRYNMVFGVHSLNIRLLTALGGKNLPPHKWFTIGGVGTLRGYPDLSETGSDLLLGNIEYRFPIRGLHWKPLRLVFNEIQGICFVDAADAWSKQWKLSGLRTDAGFGVSGANIFSYFGLYAAQALERSWRHPRVTVRLERNF